MRCPNCSSESIEFSIPEPLLDAMPERRPGAALCPHCLTVTPLDERPAGPSDWTDVHDSFPTDPAAGATVATLLALVDSLALYRGEIETVARHAESQGVDVLLVLDRLANDPAVEPHFDIDRRRPQLEQLLE